MAITVQPKLLGKLMESCDATVTLQVRSTAAADQLVAAMRAARTDLLRLGDGYPPAAALALGHGPDDPVGPKYVSAAIPLPAGPIMMIDFKTTPLELIRTVPELLTRRLEEAGVLDAEIVLPAWRPAYLTVQKFGPSATALLRGPLCSPFGTAVQQPPMWLLDIAAQWLPGEHQPGAELVGMAISVDTPLTWESLRPVMGAVLEANNMATIVTSDFTSSVAHATITGRVNPQARLITAGARWDTDEITQRLHRQRDTVRAHATTLAWAGVTVERNADGMGSTYWFDRDAPPYRPGKPDPSRPGVDMLSDILVPDAMWYQILSPGHLDRLGGPPVGAIPLADHRFELTIGEPEQWLPDHPDRDTIRARGRQLLDACLVTSDEAFAMTRQRMREIRQPHAGPPHPGL